MTARSIALQGIGAAVLVLALQGFGPEPEAPLSVVGGGIARVHRIPVPDALRLQQLEEDEIILTLIGCSLTSGIL